MTRICPYCEKETECRRIKARDTMTVRGETVEVDVEYFECCECGGQFENTRDYDALDIAYREYRCRHRMLQPEEIREWRKRYGLTQKELSRILGWGGATLSRYENGALQIEAHEKLLRLAMEPHNLKRLIADNPGALSEAKRDRLLREVEMEEEEANSFERIFEEKFGRYSPDEYSGYNRFQLSKLFNAILYFCKDGALKTKLNKLLFYADFKHFKEYSVSITGVHYIHLDFGPVPDNYEFFTAELIREKELDVREIIYGNVSGYEFRTMVEPDLSVFKDSELKVLIEIKEYFRDFGSKKIKEFSHNEKAYKETGTSEKISYLTAMDLQL